MVLWLIFTVFHLSNTIVHDLLMLPSLSSPVRPLHSTPTLLLWKVAPGAGAGIGARN